MAWPLNGRAWTIYVLIDPQTDSVRYVGCTVKPRYRLAQHIAEAKRRLNPEHPKTLWILALCATGLKPQFKVVETGQGDGLWEAAERKWISHFKENGCDLVNQTDGGDGNLGTVLSPQQRRKMSVSHYGNLVAIGKAHPVYRRDLSEDVLTEKTIHNVATVARLAEELKIIKAALHEAIVKLCWEYPGTLRQMSEATGLRVMDISDVRHGNGRAKNKAPEAIIEKLARLK